MSQFFVDEKGNCSKKNPQSLKTKKVKKKPFRLIERIDKFTIPQKRIKLDIRKN